MTIVPDWLEGNVSRETLQDLERFHDLFLKWNAKINLVSRARAVEQAHLGFGAGLAIGTKSRPLG